MSSLHGKPTRGWIAALSMLFTCAGAAYADETFFFRVAGGGTHFLDAWECPGQVCTVFATHFTWEGTVSVTVDTTAPGTYAPPHFVSMTMDWNTPYVPTVQRDVSTMYPVPTVTLAGGQVTSIDLVPIFGTPDTLTFSGLSVGYNKPPTHHSGMTFASAALIPVPEPASAWLLAVGLAVVGVAAARRATMAACTSTSSTCASSSTSPTPTA